jgi:hypothetical protein
MGMSKSFTKALQKLYNNGRSKGSMTKMALDDVLKDIEEEK